MRFLLVLRHRGSSSEHSVELELPPSNSPPLKVSLAIDGRPLEADWAEIAPRKLSILIGGRSYTAEVKRSIPERDSIYAVRVGTKTFEIEVRDPRRRRGHEAAREHAGPEEIVAPMPGRIVKVLVEEKQDVRPDEGLLVIEAMKMQNEIRAPRAGRVEKIYIQAGAGVESGAKLIRLA